MKNFFFGGLCVVGLLCLTGDLAGQMTELAVANGHCEGKMYLQDGEIYTDRIVVKFKDLVLDLPRGQRTATKADLGQQQDNLKNVLDDIDRSYGIKEIIKQIPDIVWGENERPHRRTGKPVKIINNSQLFTITFKTPVPLQSIIGQMKGLDIVDYAHEPIILINDEEPNDYYFSDTTGNIQWYFEAIQAVDAWSITHGSSEVVIGIIDDGIYSTHPDLINKITFSNGVGGIHGTQVASVAGGTTNNTIGISSLGWNTLLANYGGYIKIGDDNILVNNIYLASQHCDIINISAGTYKLALLTDIPQTCPKPGKWINSMVPYSYPEVEQEIDNAISTGVIIVSSAGNQSKNQFFPGPDKSLCDPCRIPYPKYPASYEGVIAVSGTRQNDYGIEIFNTDWNYGDFIDIASPGKYIIVTDSLSGYKIISGTSFSTPLVSALASLIIAFDPYEDVENIIKSTSDKIDSYPYTNGWNNRLGYGGINAYKALKACFPAKPQNLTLTGSVGSHPTLHWSANSESDLDGYKIYRKIDTGAEYMIANASKNTTSYTDPGIQIGGRFDPIVKYRISAHDLANNESEKSNYVTTFAGGINKISLKQGAYQLAREKRLENRGGELDLVLTEDKIVLVWNDSMRIYLQAYTYDGNPVSEPVLIAESGMNTSPLITSGKNACLLVWTKKYVDDKADIIGQYITKESVPMMANFTINSTPDEQYRWAYDLVTVDDTLFCVIWLESEGGLMGQLLSAESGKIGDTFNISGRINSCEYGPAALDYDQNSQSFIAVWVDNRDGVNRLYGRTFSRDRLIWGNTVELTDSSLVDKIWYPKVLFHSDTSYSVFYWTSDMNVYCQRFNQYGKGIDLIRRVNTVANSVDEFDVARDEYGRIVIVWEDIILGKLLCQRFNADASLLDSIFVLSSGTYQVPNEAISVDFKDGQVCAVWNDADYRIWLQVFDFDNPNKIAPEKSPDVPGKFLLEGNYPNPFNATTKIRFYLPQAGQVELKVWDCRGVLARDRQYFGRVSGWNEIEFDAGDLPSGIYLYAVSAGRQRAYGKLVLIK